MILSLSPRILRKLTLALSSSLAAFEGVNSIADEETTEDPHLRSLIRAVTGHGGTGSEFNPDKQEITAQK